MQTKGVNVNNYLKILIEQAIDEVLLKEDEGDGGDYGHSTEGSAYSGWGGAYGGGGYGSGSGTAETFGISPQFLQAMGISPLFDIIQTAAYAIKSISAAAQHFIIQLVPMFKELVIPFYHADYNEMEQKRLEHLDKLNNKYADVLGRNEVALKDHDLWGMFFMLAPERMLTTQTMRAIPRLAEELVELVGLGNPHLHQQFKDVGYFGTRRPISSRTWQGQSYGQIVGKGTLHNSKQVNGTLIREADEQPQIAELFEQNPQLFTAFVNAFKNDKNIKAFFPLILQSYVTLANDRMNTPTLEEFDQKLKGGLANVRAQIQTGVKPNEIPGASAALAAVAAEEYQKELVKRLEAYKAQTGIATPAIESTIEQIQSIKQIERKPQPPIQTKPPAKPN